MLYCMVSNHQAKRIREPLEPLLQYPLLHVLCDIDSVDPTFILGSIVRQSYFTFSQPVTLMPSSGIPMRSWRRGCWESCMFWQELLEVKLVRRIIFWSNLEAVRPEKLIFDPH